MSGQENCVRMTRLATKRAAESQVQQPITKKRTVLGEIPLNCVNGVVANKNKKLRVDPEELEHGLKKRARKAVKKVEIDEKSGPGFDVDGDLGDPQMCAAYASDIYEYLRNMEVSLIWGL